MLRMIFASILALLTSICICQCNGQQPFEQCSAANATLLNDADCYGAYLGFLLEVGLGVDTDQSPFDQVCKEGTCRSEILDFQNSCAGIEDVRTSYIAVIIIVAALHLLFGFACCLVVCKVQIQNADLNWRMHGGGGGLLSHQYRPLQINSLFPVLHGLRHICMRAGGPFACGRAVHFHYFIRPLFGDY